MLIGKFGELVATATAEEGKRFRHDEVAITDEGKMRGSYSRRKYLWNKRNSAPTSWFLPAASSPGMSL
jgi:hypothetical protein